MKQKTLNKINVFDVDDLPNMGARVKGFSYGFSIYRGVVVQWDEDEDERVLTFIDELPEEIRCQLAVVQEHEGSLGLLWHNTVPAGYKEGEEFEVENDFWVIQKSNNNKKQKTLNNYFE